MTSNAERSTKLTTTDLHRLDDACGLIRKAFDRPPYLVGSALNGTYRDVDVRLILADDEFDALFARHGRDLWELLSLAIAHYLCDRTCLPIDFQIQRQTEANERHDHPRNPLGMGRIYAAGGDATPWMPEVATTPDEVLLQLQDELRGEQP